MSQKKSDSRQLLQQQFHGVLSTHSLEVKGYPFGSVIPYCLDQFGKAIILISNLAQHFKNIKEDPKVSLIVLEGGDPEVQSVGRLTYLADAVSIEVKDQAARARYYHHFPEAKTYTEEHGFMFFRLEPVRFRYIGGFGKIYWVDPVEVACPNPFTQEAEEKILSHMNQDHKAALITYCNKQNPSLLKTSNEAAMVGIDQEGFNLLVGKRLERFCFEQAISNVKEAREALVKMAKE